MHHGPGSIPEFIQWAANRLRCGSGIVLWGSFGPPGAGKSEFNLLLADAIQKALGEPGLQPDDLPRQMVFKPLRFPDLARQAPPRKVLLVDEGTGEGAHKRRSMAKVNVDLAIDLDACRGRQQGIGWAAPNRTSIDSEILKHMQWNFELSKDHGLVAWEADQVNPIFGNRPYLHERFRLAKVPWLEHHLPSVRERYLGLKDTHMAGGDANASFAAEKRRERYRAAVKRVLR